MTCQREPPGGEQEELSCTVRLTRLGAAAPSLSDSHAILSCYMEQSLIELAREVGAGLQQRGWRLSTAESCTGGLIGHLLTEIPGSSTYYQGGVIAYDNAVKQGVLGVSAETLMTDGAVSRSCALQMAAGVRRILGTDVAIATTGIAGPGGGTIEKPVGLVYIAIEAPDGAWCERRVFGADRSLNKQQTVVDALGLLLDLLRGRTLLRS